MSEYTFSKYVDINRYTSTDIHIVANIPSFAAPAAMSTAVDVDATSFSQRRAYAFVLLTVRRMWMFRFAKCVKRALVSVRFAVRVSRARSCFARANTMTKVVLLIYAAISPLLMRVWKRWRRTSNNEGYVFFLVERRKIATVHQSSAFIVVPLYAWLLSQHICDVSYYIII